MLNIPMSFDESYQMTKLWDTLRDMDFDLNDHQTAVFERITTGECDSSQSDYKSIPERY